MVRGVILDAGPLLDLLLYRFWTDQRRPVDENRLICTQLGVSPQQLSRFLGSCPRIFLVPGVIVEVGRLAREEVVYWRGKAKKLSLASFWRLTIRELKLMGIDEKWTKFFFLDRKIVEELGPTDAALIRCAQELSQERIPILTHDQPLWGQCHKVHVSCMVTSEILPWIYTV